jgi:hypothetical protein
MWLSLRLLICAVLVGSVLAPLASSQMEQPEIYAYDNFAQAGSQMYAYSMTALAAPQNHCGGWSGFCWWEYTSYAAVDLWWDDWWMNGYYYSQYNGWASAWAYAPVWPGEWEFQPTHAIYNIDYMDAFWFELFYGVVSYPSYPWSIYINPVVTVSSGQDVEDSESFVADFDVTVEGLDPTGYQWSFTPYASGGNNPDVQFSAPQAASTSTNAHWYAYPNLECGASRNAYYDVWADVSFGDYQQGAGSSLAVHLPLEGGSTGWPVLSGTYLAGFLGGTYYIAYSAFWWSTSPPQSYGVQPSSQFYSKVHTHEEVHLNQYNPPNGLLADLFSPTEAAARVSTLSDTTEAGLSAKFYQTVNDYVDWSGQQRSLRQNAAEREAYGVSDSISPQYIYQRCGRFSN